MGMLDAPDEKAAVPRHHVAWEMAAVLTVGAVAAVWPVFSHHWGHYRDDVDLYLGYAQAFWFGAPRFHAMPSEYPSPALVLFTLPLLMHSLSYRIIFAAWMSILAVAGYLGFRRFSSVERARAYTVYLIVGASHVLLVRYDIAPALLTVAALWAARRQRFRIAYLALGFGVLLKIYPIFLLPVLLIEHRKHLASSRATHLGRTERSFMSHPILHMALAVLPMLACGMLSAFVASALNRRGAISPLTYAVRRPIQVESAPATLLWIGTWMGIPASPVRSFSSHNYTGPLSASIISLCLLLCIAGCGLICWAHARGRLTLGRAMLATVCVVVLTNRVFSAQYLIWLIVLAAAVEGWDAVWLAICALTTLEYPFLYLLFARHWSHHYPGIFLGVLAIRNGLLLYALYRVIWPERARQHSELMWSWIVALNDFLVGPVRTPLGVPS